ncbi:MAG: glycosyltransferase [Candidatus Lokiarchaeia archaeon]
MSKKIIYWVNLNRFDMQPDKSTYMEMAKFLNQDGFYVHILTGYKQNKYNSKSTLFSINYFRSLDIGCIFRLTLLLNIMLWLLINSSRDNIYLLHPNAMFIAPLLKIFGRNNIHLDIRTLPVDIHSLKEKFDYLIYWVFPITFFGKMAKSYSFITDLLREEVENEFNNKYSPYVIWESGVNTDLFTKELTNLPISNKFNIFYHGSITENRGISRVVDAMKCLPISYKKQMCFVIVGDGSGLNYIRNLVSQESMSEYIEIKGMIAYENIPREIAMADCCICPLPDRLEWNVSSPLKVFEYMASSKPIILTPIPAHKNVLANQKFILWTDGDSVEDYVNAIKKAFDNRQFLEKEAKIAPDIVRKKYDWLCQGKKFADHLHTYYREMT